MNDSNGDVLARLSEAVSSRVESSRRLLAGVETGAGRTLSGILWRGDAVVTSEQALPDQESFTASLPDGAETPARLAGRDPGTNVAVLRLANAVQSAPAWAGAEPRVGAFALALGARAGLSARFAVVQAVGPAWHSLAGGYIDRLIRLDMRASRVEEGGPVIDAGGGLLGMATAGPRGRMLVIPPETIARVLDPLLAEGRVPRGWLGVGLQPVSVPEALRDTAGQDSGLMVVSLAKDGPAEQGGILPGDILLSIGGEVLRRPRAIRSVLGPERIGKEAEIRLLRAGIVQTCRIKIVARPAE